MNLRINNVTKTTCIQTILLFIPFFVFSQDYTPVTTPIVNVCDTFYASHIICDPYRWLEETNSDATKTWILKQNDLSEKYLQRSRYNTKAYEYLDQYAAVKTEFASKCGKYYFTNYITNSFTTSSLGIRANLNSIPHILVDPKSISDKDLISIDEFSVDQKSELLAYQFSRNGSDNKEIKVVSIKSEKHLEDHLTGIKFSDIHWLGNGFFYSTFDQESYFGPTKNECVFYHRIGQLQSEDKLIFKTDNQIKNNFSYTVTADGQYFFLTNYNPKSKKYSLYFIDQNELDQTLKPLIRNLDKPLYIFDRQDDLIFGHTLKGDVSKSIVTFNVTKPYEWTILIDPSENEVILDVVNFNEKIVSIIMQDQKPSLKVFNKDGDEEYALTLPLGSSVQILNQDGRGDELFFALRSYTAPTVLYTLDLNTFIKEYYQPVDVSYDYKNIVTEQLHYFSKDSTEVSMTVIYDKSKRPNVPTPCILEAYGGFNVIEQPSFDPGIIYLIRTGGVYAFANIRGGGDKGIQWSRAGKGKNKQKSFDDFIAAAEFLISENITTSSLLGITGKSNGGLVVAAAAIQRPDLFKVIVPIVAPLDMIRFEKFTVGNFHTPEYGTVTDSLSFTSLKSYSPLHNIRDEINYPSMLFVTSENDDRVPPFHSYKCVAAMQNRTAQKNPILLKVESKAGHNGSQISEDYFLQLASIYGFILNEIQKN